MLHTVTVLSPLVLASCSLPSAFSLAVLDLSSKPLIDQRSSIMNGACTAQPAQNRFFLEWIEHLEGAEAQHIPDGVMMHTGMASTSGFHIART